MYIKNRDELISHGQTKSRRTIIDIVEHALSATDPYLATLKLVSLDGNTLSVGGLHFDLSNRGRIYLLGAGKATFPVAKGLEEILGDRISDGLIIVKEGQEGTLEKVRMRVASHPLPDERGFEAAKEMIALAEATQEGDIVFCAISGGSSALAPLPVPGVTVLEKRMINKLLLYSGASIREINAVRKHLSSIKGGRLALSIFPAEIINLTVSDVTGDPLDYITDLTVPDTSSFEDAIQTLRKHDLMESIPKSAREYLLNATADMEGPKDFNGRPVHTFVLVKGSEVCEAANNHARELGLASTILTTTLEGESIEASHLFTGLARRIKTYHRPLAPPCVVIAGGETTVTISDVCGKGGPNQELAIGAALQLADTEDVTVASIDTDGTDGPTEFAGGIVDNLTAKEALEKGVNLRKSLLLHDASTALEAIGSSIRTGHTGTNVNDLIVMLVD